MAARQENSSKSLRILMAIGAPYVASSSPSASQDVGQKVMVDWLNLDGARGAEDRQDRKPMDFACSAASAAVPFIKSYHAPSIGST